MFFDMFQIFCNKGILILYSEKKRTKTKSLKLDGYGNLPMNVFWYMDLYTLIYPS